MARELFAHNFGSHGDFGESSFCWPPQISSGSVMFLLFGVFMFFILVPFVIFDCGSSSDQRQRKKKKDGGRTNYAVWGAGYQDVGNDGHRGHGDGGDGQHSHSDGGGCGGDGGNT